jgi:hypothetical protein
MGFTLEPLLCVDELHPKKEPCMLENFSVGTIAFLVGAVTAILLYLAFLWWRNPVLMKIGLRNLARRKGQSVLIIIGLTLSTIIVSSSLGVGDTLRFSVQKQAVSAYGKVDEIIAPPLLSMLAGMANPNVDPAQAEQTQATLDNLMQGGLESVLALAQGGLPSISADRLARLHTAAAQEPLIDGVAGSIVFPTIIRNVSTGQSEPLGFIFAVNDDYTAEFGLTSVNGEPLTMETTPARRRQHLCAGEQSLSRCADADRTVRPASGVAAPFRHGAKSRCGAGAGRAGRPLHNRRSRRAARCEHQPCHARRAGRRHCAATCAWQGEPDTTRDCRVAAGGGYTEHAAASNRG